MDMLVRLYAIEDATQRLRAALADDVLIRRAMSHERADIIEWVQQNFPREARPWGSEVAVALSRVPAGCYIAVRGEEMLGFACHDATAPGFFGPTGTAESERGQGIGAALLVSTLQGMRAAGHAYAIIGGVGEHVRGFYENAVGAVAIAGSTPGIYARPVSL